jgi:hypothetical protein
LGSFQGFPEGEGWNHQAFPKVEAMRPGTLGSRIQGQHIALQILRLPFQMA